MINKQDKPTLDKSWIDELYYWADKNNIPELQFIEDDFLCDDEETGVEGFWVGLPRDREVLVNLEELDLTWHSCSEIPEQIKYLKKLKKFTFSKRRDGCQPPFMENADRPGVIKEIPDWIAELECLEELDLSNNRISFVPNVIGTLHNLKKLYLHNNPIMFVDTDFASLVNLKVLWMRWNTFTILDDCLLTMKKELGEFDVDWRQKNKISLLSDCMDLIFSQGWGGEKLIKLVPERLTTLSYGLNQLQKIKGVSGKEMLWHEWQRLNRFKYKLKKLTNLQELYCDGFEYPQGPIRLCHEGVIVTTDMEPDLEGCVDVLLGETPAFFITNDKFEVLIKLDEHHGKGLIEKLEYLNLAKDL